MCVCWQDAPKISADQAWHDAFKAFQKVLSESPRGKYFNDARGWLAYLHLRVGDRVNALIQYYRLLGDEHDENARVEGAFSLMLVRSPATDDEMERVEKALANEPAAALAYAYHNIYNYSIDPDPIDPPYDYETIKDRSGQTDFEAERLRREEVEKKWKAERAATSRKELTRALEFSKRLMVNYPNLSVGGAFALRAAQASEELDDNVFGGDSLDQDVFHAAAGVRFTGRWGRTWGYGEVLGGVGYLQFNGIFSGLAFKETRTRPLAQMGGGLTFVVGDGWGIFVQADYRRMFLDEEEDLQSGRNDVRASVGFRLILD